MNRSNSGGLIGRWVAVWVLAAVTALVAVKPVRAGDIAILPDARIRALPTGQLQVTDVQNIIAQAVTQAVHDHQNVVVAVTDREGNVLGVFDMNGAPTASKDDALGIFSVNGATPTPQQIAIQKARTAAFLSSDQNAFSTRTALQITAKHFPPNVDNSPPGPLFGLPMSSLPCGDVQKNGSGLTGALGGFPLYMRRAIAGGVGVDGARTPQDNENMGADEVIAMAGLRHGYGPPSSITADGILVGGIRFDYAGPVPPADLTPMPFASLPGQEDPNFPLMAGSPPPMETIEAGVPGEWRFPPADSTVSNLTAADVVKITDQALKREKITRAAIRLPVGIPTRMQVGVTDIAGNILGVFRTNDATMFSLDIVIQKGRTVTSFTDPNQALGQRLRGDLGLGSSAALASTSRTIEFLAQPFYPPGINGTAPGPLFCFGSFDPALPYCFQQQLFFMQPSNGCLPNGNGITLFPGSTPLYKDGVLVGGLGISGDGVDQDDFVTNFAAKGFLPPNRIRANRIKFRGTFLPFFKYPRHPLLD